MSAWNGKATCQRSPALTVRFGRRRHESCTNSPSSSWCSAVPAGAHVDVLAGLAVEPHLAADAGDAAGQERVERPRVGEIRVGGAREVRVGEHRVGGIVACRRRGSICGTMFWFFIQPLVRVNDSPNCSECCPRSQLTVLSMFQLLPLRLECVRFVVAPVSCEPMFGNRDVEARLDR